MKALGFRDYCLPLSKQPKSMVRRMFFVMALMVLCMQAAGQTGRKFVLVIDPGHGGRDTGAPGAYSKEKNINLDVALSFGRYVERNNPDVKVVYTRKTDVFVPLYERAEIANRCKADLFVSIHTNALPHGRVARGFETYTLGDGRSQATKTNLEVAKRENSVILLEDNYQQHYVGYDPNSPESNIMFEFVQDKNLSKSVDMAKMMQKHVCRTASRPNKGVHQSNLAVLRLASMPACLLELGFITTPDEERLLNDKKQKDKLALGIYNAFVEYKNKHYNGIVVPYKTGAQATDDNRKDEEPIVEQPLPDHGNDVNDIRQMLDDGDKAAEPVEKQPEPTEDRTEPMEPNVANQQPERALPDSRPVFKVQIIAGEKRLKPNDRAFKGLLGCESYVENGMVKYTYGASTDYNEVYRTRKQILEKFPGAFIIAFKDGMKMDVNQAIKEFKQNRIK